MVTASDAATSANDNHGGIWGIPRPRVGCRVRGRGAGQAGTGDPLSTSGRISGLVIGSAGWITEFEPNGFTTATLGGKEVYVGTIEVLGLVEHQRGRPYWYELDAQTLAIVVTEEEAGRLTCPASCPAPLMG
jgi:hypothetical protein